MSTGKLFRPATLRTLSRHIAPRTQPTSSILPLCSTALYRNTMNPTTNTHTAGLATTTGAHPGPAESSQKPMSTLPQPGQIKDSFHADQPVEVLIKNDHRSFEELFERYKGWDRSDIDGRKAIVNELIREVSQHSVAEELLVYPLIEKQNMFQRGTEVADHLRDDHAIVKNLMYEIDNMKDINDPAFDQKLTHVMGVLKEHATEEETKELPELQKILSVEKRISLSGDFIRRKAIAPTRPHPDAPDKPAMLEAAAGVPLHATDVARDQTRHFAARAVEQF